MADIRDQYLSQWNWPTMNRQLRDTWLSGRICSAKEALFFVQQTLDQPVRELNVEVFEINKDFDLAFDPQGANACEVFRPGDWIAWQVLADATVRILLLSPNSKADFPVGKSSSRDFTGFLRNCHKFMAQLGYEEVRTPTLVPCPGLEPHLVPFQTRWVGSGDFLYLPTSPEIHLKKLLCRGYQNVYEIKTVFRDEPASPQHRPEFHMLEFYRSMADLEDLEEDLKRFLQLLIPPSASLSILDSESWQRVSVRELFHAHLGFDLHPETTSDDLVRLGHKTGVDMNDNDSFDEAYQKIWIEKIEPNWHKYPTALVIFDFPPSQAALSRINSDGWSDRFELYLGGVECANAYQELQDPVEQKRRFESFQSQRRDSVPIDEEFLDHLCSGMPPTAGIAIGLERIFMAINGVKNIEALSEF